MEKYSTLQARLSNFEGELERQKAAKLREAERRKEELLELQENYEERNNGMIARMEELKRKETLLITLQKILPDVPEDFPKNYFCQLVYEDTVLTGTQKFTDFD